MAFFTSAISTLQTLVIALGAGLGVWGVINLLEGYGNDNRVTRSPLKRLCAWVKGKTRRFFRWFFRKPAVN